MLFILIEFLALKDTKIQKKKTVLNNYETHTIVSL